MQRRYVPKNINFFKLILIMSALSAVIFISAFALIYFCLPTQGDCARVMREVQALNLPVGGHPNVSVPGLKLFYSEELDVAVLPDGRTVLLIKTSIGWKGNYDGYVYASAPLTTAEFASDYYGREEILIPGLGSIVVRKKYSATFFKVFFDLN